MAKLPPLVVYWAPVISSSEDGEWNMLYPEPTRLWESIMKDKNPARGSTTYTSCPAAVHQFKNTFVFKNALESIYSYDFTQPGAEYMQPTSSTYLSCELTRPPAVLTGPTIDFKLKYVFFAEEPVTATFTPPIFSKPKYFQYASVVPGKMDIGSWFRPYTLEMQLWDSKGTLTLEDDEPLFYIDVNTDREVTLKRFKMTSNLIAIIDHCTKSTDWMGRGTPLVERYRKFRASRTNDLVLQEIKNNLL